MLTLAHVALIQMLTDMAIQIMTTVSQVGTMTDGQVKAAIPEAEAVSKELEAKIRAH